MNPDEIQPGETTCGFLKAPLGWEVEDLNVVYPMVKTYVCITFATQQPAPRGEREKGIRCLIFVVPILSDSDFVSTCYQLALF